MPTAMSPYSAPSATLSASVWGSVATRRPVIRSARQVGRDHALGVAGVVPGQRGLQVAVREDGGGVGEGHRALGPLLDEKDRDPLLADLPERFEDDVDHPRREAERGLV